MERKGLLEGERKGDELVRAYFLERGKESTTSREKYSRQTVLHKDPLHGVTIEKELMSYHAALIRNDTVLINCFSMRLDIRVASRQRVLET